MSKKLINNDNRNMASIMVAARLVSINKYDLIRSLSYFINGDAKVQKTCINCDGMDIFPK